MVGALDSGTTAPSSSPGRGHCVVSLGKTTLTVPLSTQVEILPVALCYRNRDKLRPDGPLGPNADFTWVISALERYYFEPDMLQTPEVIAVRIVKWKIAWKNDRVCWPCDG